MSTQKTTIVLFLFIASFIAIGFLKFNIDGSNKARVNDKHREAVRSVSKGNSDRYIEQRNRLSKTLNQVKQELSMLGCQLAEVKDRRAMVASSGGWCKKTSSSKGGSHMFDKSLAEELASLFNGQSVASFGDGPGDYKKFIDKTNKVKVYDAFDGAPYGPETSGGAVQFLDLTAPQYGLKVYDWIISLEVAEHIPAKYESVYIDNIVRHAGKGIVLSWAVPGQGGLAHINNKPLTYVQKSLSDKGFEPDMTTSKVLQEQATLGWLKKNTYVYMRRRNSTLRRDDA